MYIHRKKLNIPIETASFAMRKVDYFDWGLSTKHPLSWTSIIAEEKPLLQPNFDIHSAIHLIIIREGTLHGFYFNTDFTIRPGQIFLSAPWELHSTMPPGNARKFYLLNIDPDALRGFFFTGFERLERVFNMPPGERFNYINSIPNFQECLEGILSILEGPEHPLQEIRLWHAVLRLMLELDPPHSLSASESLTFKRLLPALKHLGCKVLSTPDAAKLCNLSTSRFACIFKKQFGLNFAQYERMFRLNGAKFAIQSGATLKEAANEWDFCDKSHLARLLKKTKHNTD